MPISAPMSARSRTITASIELEPDQATGYVARGLTYARRGDFEYALRDFDRAIALDAKSASPISTEVASISARATSSAPFATIARRSISGRKSASAFESRGFAYLSQGQIDKAIADYDAALQLDAKRATALFARGTAKLKKGDTSGDEDIATAKAIKPDIAAGSDLSGVQ